MQISIDKVEILTNLRRGIPMHPTRMKIAFSDDVEEKFLNKDLPGLRRGIAIRLAKHFILSVELPLREFNNRWHRFGDEQFLQFQKTMGRGGFNFNTLQGEAVENIIATVSFSRAFYLREVYHSTMSPHSTMVPITFRKGEI